MADTISRYLKLKIADDLSADAKYNLQRLDSLGASIGSTFVTGLGDKLSILSRGDIQLVPNDSSIGGPGSGGTLTLGDDNNPATVIIEGTAFLLNCGLSLKNGATSANNYLTVSFLNAANLTTPQSLTIAVGTGDRSITFPEDGVVVTTTGIQTLVDKDITGTFTGPLTGNVTGNVSGTAANVTGVVAVANGGTGASAAPAAIQNLLPSYAGNNARVLALTSDGSALEWKATGGGVVETISASAPLTVDNTIPAFPVLTLPQATGLVNGYLSASDWTSFTNKEPSLGLSNSTTYLRGDRVWSTLDVAAVSGLQSALDAKYNASNPAGYVNAAGAAAAAPVQSVNGQINIVSLTTTNIGEGTSLYFTDTRARTAAVVNSTAGSETDQAASVSAMKAYVTAQGGGVTSFTWATADGVTKSITHSLNTTTVLVSVYDENGEDILVDTVDRTSSNEVSLTSSVPPTGNWTVVIRP